MIKAHSNPGKIEACRAEVVALRRALEAVTPALHDGATYARSFYESLESDDDLKCEASEAIQRLYAALAAVRAALAARGGEKHGA